MINKAEQFENHLKTVKANYAKRVTPASESGYSFEEVCFTVKPLAEWDSSILTVQFFRRLSRPRHRGGESMNAFRTDICGKLHQKLTRWEVFYHARQFAEQDARHGAVKLSDQCGGRADSGLAAQAATGLTEAVIREGLVII